jgi:polysaccharide pyruvyl transferase WcaK-like protein
MKQRSPKIWLLGATLETSNMGVSALAEASLKCIFAHWPDAEVTIRAHLDQSPIKLTIGEREVTINRLGLWIGNRIWIKNHLYRLVLYALLLKLIPLPALRRQIEAHNPNFKAVMESDLVVDITGGDSFSDIYGTRKFILNALPKWLFLLCGKKLVLLPQTYGPFNSNLSKRITKYLLAQATAIYSRDRQGIEEVKTLLGPAVEHQIIKFIPDVAFVLDTEKPNLVILEQLEQLKNHGHILVGLNISGLLYNNGHQANKKFGLKTDYRELVNKIIRLFMAKPQTIVVLVPHVFSDKSQLESDPQACYLVHEQMKSHSPDRLLLVTDTLNHKQVKYLIGRCDFFLGARMHACIGAISQYVPALGMAYSGKFKGVFDSVGVGDAIIDLRTEDDETILARVTEAFINRLETAAKLRVTIPEIQKTVIGLFDEIETHL